MTRKKIPKKVTILGQVFTVKIVDAGTLQKETGFSSVGGMNFSRRIILVKNNMSADDTWLTFLHECVHVGTFMAGLNQVTIPEVQEIWCETLANTFMDIFVR
jgi:hypothetical protein